MGILNKLTTFNALDPKQKDIYPVVTLNSSTNTMPKEGRKLLDNGYKLQSVTCDGYGKYSWFFVLPQYAA